MHLLSGSAPGRALLSKGPLTIFPIRTKAMKILRFTSAILFTFSVLACVANAQTAKRLFEILETPEKSVAPSSLASVRESKLAIDQHISGREILIPLFDGKTYKAVENGSEVRALDDRTWRGKLIEKKFEGDVIITFRKGFVSGLIYSPDAVYEIVPRGDSHYLVQLDQSLFPECASDVKGENSAMETAISEGPGTDSGDRIDVLIMYTTATKNFLGGDAQAQVFAQQGIDATNTAYINSKIRQRVRLVSAQEFVYTETASAQTDLSNFRANATVQSLRDSTNADLAAMLGEIAGACGVGYLIGPASGNPNNGFTVTARSCAVGNLTLAHEMGHNMGSHHNPENGGTAVFPYSYGHYVNGSYRTVMSYVDPCTSGCVRSPYFSNPNVVYLGQPTGIPNARDNARSINNTADVISNYQYSGSSITLSSLNAGERINRIAARNISWSSSNVSGDVRIEISRNESTTWQTLVASTPNDGAETISIGGRPNRTTRLRIVSVANPTVSDSSVINFTVR